MPELESEVCKFLTASSELRDVCEDRCGQMEAPIPLLLAGHMQVPSQCSTTQALHFSRGFQVVMEAIRRLPKQSGVGLRDVCKPELWLNLILHQCCPLLKGMLFWLNQIMLFCFLKLNKQLIETLLQKDIMCTIKII